MHVGALSTKAKAQGGSSPTSQPVGMIEAIPTANTNLAGLGFGAMDPLLAPVLC